MRAITWVVYLGGSTWGGQGGGTRQNEKKIIPADIEKLIRERVKAYLEPKIQLLVREEQIEPMPEKGVDWLVKRLARLEIDQWRKADHKETMTRITDLQAYWREMPAADQENLLDDYVRRDDDRLETAILDFWTEQVQTTGR